MLILAQMRGILNGSILRESLEAKAFTEREAHRPRSCQGHTLARLAFSPSVHVCMYIYIGRRLSEAHQVVSHTETHRGLAASTGHDKSPQGAGPRAVGVIGAGCRGRGRVRTVRRTASAA